MKLSHLVDAEYGNQGIDFKMVPREGFGWMNGEDQSLLPDRTNFCTAAYQVGLTFLTMGMRRAVAACTSPEVFFGRAADAETAAAQATAAAADPLDLAMEALSLAA